MSHTAMQKRFDEFMKPLKETLFTLGDYVDFTKVAANVGVVLMRLNQLNFLIGQQDIDAAVRLLWSENPKAFLVLEILVAVRAKDGKKAIDESGYVHSLSDYSSSPESVVEFLNQTGLSEVFRSKQIKNLVDYVFGVEVGLDSNARKNRGGHLMEDYVAGVFSKNGVKFESEVYCTEFPEIATALGTDKKRFDFVVRTDDVVYLIETNFYSSGGSKLNEVARSYLELAQKINAVPGFEFVWITDGVGWQSARNKLEEAYSHIPNIYNLTDVSEFISRIKRQQV